MSKGRGLSFDGFLSSVNQKIYQEEGAGNGGQWLS